MEHSRHRSIRNFFMNSIYTITAYYSSIKKVRFNLNMWLIKTIKIVLLKDVLSKTRANGYFYRRKRMNFLKIKINKPKIATQFNKKQSSRVRFFC